MTPNEVVAAIEKMNADKIARLKPIQIQMDVLQAKMDELHEYYQQEWQKIQDVCPHKDKHTMFFFTCEYCGKVEW
jgi:hypothetical protein